MQYLGDEFFCYDFISKEEILRVVLKIQGRTLILVGNGKKELNTPNTTNPKISSVGNEFYKFKNFILSL